MKTWSVHVEWEGPYDQDKQLAALKVLLKAYGHPTFTWSGATQQVTFDIEAPTMAGAIEAGMAVLAEQWPDIRERAYSGSVRETVRRGW